MAIDTAEKARSVFGVGRPWWRSKSPSALLDQAWRVGSGSGYTGNLLPTTIPEEEAVAVEAVVPSCLTETCLRSLQRQVKEDVIYNSCFGAREVSVKLASGMMKRLTVRLATEHAREEEGDGIEIIERLKVTICRVSEECGNTKGFVTLPSPGIKLYRDFADDPWSPMPYVWDGEIVEEWPTQWILMFNRSRVYGEGLKG